MIGLAAHDSQGVHCRSEDGGHRDSTKDHKGDASDKQDGVNCFHRAKLIPAESGVQQKKGITDA